VGAIKREKNKKARKTKAFVARKRKRKKEERSIP